MDQIPCPLPLAFSTETRAPFAKEEYHALRTIERAVQHIAMTVIEGLDSHSSLSETTILLR